MTVYVEEVPGPKIVIRQPCKNCHASGTIFPKGIKAKPKVCPVCKGSCKVPYTAPQPQ